MGKLTRHAKAYDGQKTVIVVLDEWLEKYGDIPEVGNSIITEAHTGTITEVHQTNDDAAVVTFAAYKKLPPVQKKKRVSKAKAKPAARRIAVMDRMDVLNSHYTKCPGCGGKLKAGQMECDHWAAEYQDHLAEQAQNLELLFQCIISV